MISNMHKFPQAGLRGTSAGFAHGKATPITRKTVAAAKLEFVRVGKESDAETLAAYLTHFPAKRHISRVRSYEGVRQL